MDEGKHKKRRIKGQNESGEERSLRSKEIGEKRKEKVRKLSRWGGGEGRKDVGGRRKLRGRGL